MAQNLEFSATSGLTLTATAYSIGTYSGGTNASSVTQQAGTNRYLAAFASNLTAGAYRLDYLVSGTCIGNEVYDVDGSGTYQPRSEAELSTTLTSIQTSINNGTAIQSAPVATAGTISRIIIGDDYLAANDRQFSWTVAEPTGCVAATSECWFGGKDKAGNTWRVQGTITDNGSTWTLSFDLAKTDTADLICGIASWSVEIVNVSSAEITVVRTSEQDDPTLLVEKYT